jgi:chorismate mutase
MDAARLNSQRLEEVRRAIDEIDAELLDLLERRFAISRDVAAIKALDPAAATVSPVRPAREAAILRRLLERSAGAAPPAVLVRIWRHIISGSTLVQAPAMVRAPQDLLADPERRDLLRDHFGTVPLAAVADSAAALTAIRDRPAEIAAVVLAGDWLRPLGKGAAGAATVIGVLPAFSDGSPPVLALVGHALPEPSGADETLVVTSGRLPRDFSPTLLWEIETETGERLTSLPGFLSDAEPPLVGLKRSNERLALNLIGRYPSPLELRQP